MNPDLRRHRVVIVEDEAVTAMEIEALLQQAGYTLAGTFHRAEDLLACVDEARPVLAIVDIRLPGAMDGIELATHLRERGIAVVFISAYQDSETVARAKLIEPSQYLVKPLDGRVLPLSLELALHKHERMQGRRHARAVVHLLLQSLHRRREGLLAGSLPVEPALETPPGGELGKELSDVALFEELDLLELPAFLTEGDKLRFANPVSRRWFRGDDWPAALPALAPQLQWLERWSEPATIWSAVLSLASADGTNSPVLCVLGRLEDGRVLGLLQNMAPWVSRGESEAWEYAEFLSDERERVLDRIARDLHEDIAQRLATVKMGLEAAPLESAHELRKELAELMGEVIADLRGLTDGIVPIAGPTISMASSLRALCDRLGRAYGTSIRYDVASVTACESLRTRTEVVWLLHRLLAALLSRESHPTQVRCCTEGGRMIVRIGHPRLAGLEPTPQRLLQARLGGIVDGLRRIQKLKGAFELDAGSAELCFWLPIEAP